MKLRDVSSRFFCTCFSVWEYRFPSPYLFACDFLLVDLRRDLTRDFHRELTRLDNGFGVRRSSSCEASATSGASGGKKRVQPWRVSHGNRSEQFVDLGLT
jgi:hypothetical protein